MKNRNHEMKIDEESKTVYTASVYVFVLSSSRL